jgi:hypothetical protein
MKTIITRRSGLSAMLLLGFVMAAGAVPVTFQVNMEVQTIVGTFNPAAGHTVELHGSFDGWGPGVTLSQSLTNTNVYTATVDLSGMPGSTVQFKYVINQAGTLVWENDGVGSGGPRTGRSVCPQANKRWRRSISTTSHHRPAWLR